MVTPRCSFASGITARIQKLDAQPQKRARNCGTVKGVPGAVGKCGNGTTSRRIEAESQAKPEVIHGTYNAHPVEVHPKAREVDF
jgi:hypothetical protein